jgi:aryl-alcohol dehydrogenase-like predicted oxidoreductase
MNPHNKIILGTVQFGLNYGINNSSGQILENEVINILDLAWSSKIQMLDTAAAYGTSEEQIGRFINSHKNAEFKIITKFNLKAGSSPIQSLERSLQKLNLDRVETIMFHSYEDFKKTTNSSINSLLEQRGRKFNKLGISLYTNEQVDDICEMNLFDVVQIPFNALDNESLRGIHFKKLKSLNIEVHTRSVFLQGLFFMEPLNIPKKLRPLVESLNKIDSIAAKYELDKSALLIQYALSKTDIDAVLVGVDSIEHLEKNLSSLGTQVNEEALDEIDSIRVEDYSLLNPATWSL